MDIFHNSRDEKYRLPKGALPEGATVRLSVETRDGVPDEAYVRLWDGAESLKKMEIKASGDGAMCSAELKVPQKRGLFWYCFLLKKDGREYWYTNNEARLGGVGRTVGANDGNSYQITVYGKEFKTPDWFKDGIMYQIFPDRFFKTEKSFADKKGWFRMHADWYEEYFFDRHPFENGPACNDFYGGSLKGIEEKLDYLKALGVTVLYLNPIFEAFSNHRYDTGDYSKIDPILGTEEDFSRLCKKAEALGIRIILDGVFSHTGSDSVYFNKYKTYGEGAGAYQSTASPYHKWFCWREDGSYESWWGCSNLPNVNETEATYIDYILTGDNAIIKKWLKAGASGWRLDVADELPDEFIKILRREVKKEKSDAVVIGEVWEDASNKVSYGKNREYLFGDELDSVMNYPFKDGALSFLNGEISAEDFAERMESIAENYPKEALYSAMNILGTHDTRRVKTVLGGQYIKDGMTEEEKARFRLDAANESTAITRLKLAAFMQMTFWGVPCIYYGDEIGMQGLEDPFNRRPYTWRCVDPELLEYYKKLTVMRHSLDCLRTGEFKTVYAKDGVYMYLRQISKSRDVFDRPSENGAALCVINRSSETVTLEAELCELPKALKGFLNGEVLEVREGRIKLNALPYSAEAYVG